MSDRRDNRPLWHGNKSHSWPYSYKYEVASRHRNDDRNQSIAAGSVRITTNSPSRRINAVGMVPTGLATIHDFLLTPRERGTRDHAALAPSPYLLHSTAPYRNLLRILGYSGLFYLTLYDQT